MRVGVSKSFIKGMTRVISLANTKEWPDLSNGQQKDYMALRGDWYNVGKRIRKQIAQALEQCMC